MMKTLTMFAHGMTCGGCANALRKSISAVPGVIGVDIEVPTKKVTVTHGDETTKSALEEAVKNAGFRPAEGKA